MLLETDAAEVRAAKATMAQDAGIWRLLLRNECEDVYMGVEKTLKIDCLNDGENEDAMNPLYKYILKS